MTRSSFAKALVALTLSTTLFSNPVFAQLHDHQHESAERLGAPEELGNITQALKDHIRAEFLTDEQRAELRNAHGLWTQEDLINPKFASQAALDIGLYDHPSLMSPHAPSFVRAQAAIRRGEPKLALEILDAPLETLTIPELNLHAHALEMLGQTQPSIISLELIESKLLESQINDANTIAFAVESLMSLTRLRGPQRDAKSEYQQLAELLANARDHIDRLNWRIRLVEARLLLEHNNYKDAHTAAVETLRLHPRNADAAALIANMAVDSFDFDTADEVINKLNSIAAFTFGTRSETPPPTLHSAIVNARIALRQKDPHSAEAAIDPMLAAMPNQRDLLALNAASAAAGFRKISTQHHLNAFDALSPNSPIALMSVAQTLSEYRQYDDAADILRQTIELAPNWAIPRTDLGLMLVQAGRDKEAKIELEQALKLNPFNLRAKNSLKLVTELLSYETIETEHFIIRYKPDTTDSLLAHEMPEILENIHNRVCADLPGGVSHEPISKTLIELMPNHEWFAVRIGGMPSIHTMAASTGPVIAIEAPKVGKKSSIGPYDWPRVLQHEYTHTVNLSRTKNRVIHWMTEANAVYNEDSPRSSRTWAMLTSAYENDELFDLIEINNAFVRPKKPSDRSLAYAQGAWMFEFIHEQFGQDAPLDIFDASASGRSANEAFEEVLDVTPESFLSEFRSWAKQELIARGLLLDDDLPDLTELFDTSKENPASIPSLNEIDTLLKKYPDHPQLITLKLGIVLASSKDRLAPEVEKLLINAIDIRPTDESPHRRLSKHYLSSENTLDHLNAIPHLEFLDAREIHSPIYASELALLYARADQPDLALSKALRAVNIAPYDADQREQAARVALLINDLDQTKHQLQALITLEPDQPIHQKRLDALIARLND